jgi:D-sedoheptulose 7-phosphate isomerase
LNARDAILEHVTGARLLLAAVEEDAALLDGTAAAASLVADCLGAGGKLLLCGNGGSAADAQHWAAELVGRFARERPGLPALALTTDSSALTAIGNDYGFEAVFARQVAALARPGDVLFALSTSGRSPNILAALAAARDAGMRSVGFTGASGGGMAPWCDVLLRVPSRDTPHIQVAHAVLGHAICGLIEARLFPG